MKKRKTVKPLGWDWERDPWCTTQPTVGPLPRRICLSTLRGPFPVSARYRPRRRGAPAAPSLRGNCGVPFRSAALVPSPRASSARCEPRSPLTAGVACPAAVLWYPPRADAAARPSLRRRGGRAERPGSGLVSAVAVSIEIGSMGSSSQHDATSAPGNSVLSSSLSYAASKWLVNWARHLRIIQSVTTDYWIWAIQPGIDESRGQIIVGYPYSFLE
jgi:hypothetical protein